MVKNVTVGFDKYRFDNELLYNLMPFKIGEILLISSLYDAYILENERILSEQIFGEYHKLNLSSAPKITHAPTLNSALEILKKKSFDMVIVMRRISDSNIFEIGERIKRLDNRCFILLLLNNNSEIALIKDKKFSLSGIDNVFVWNGDSKVFLAMIKYIEDKVNAANDTKISMARIILLVEDSIRYYSRFLPILYTQIVKQTQRLIADESPDEMIKILRMRTRPKIMLARNYEEAVEIIDNYREYLLCLISDVKFQRNGNDDEEAGIDLISYLRSLKADVPTLLQSSNPENRAFAEKLESAFIYKESQHLERELIEFMLNSLGFGDFIFKDSNGNEIARARSMEDFKRIIKNIGIESVMYHARRNHFSAWLLARGEVYYAKILHPVKIEDFKNPMDLKAYIMDIFETARMHKTKGRIISFDESMLDQHSHILKLSGGSLGGKGRGLAFINSILQKIESNGLVEGIDVKIPLTTIIGTDEFESFMEKGSFSGNPFHEKDFSKIQKSFLESDLSSELYAKLKRLLKTWRQPLAIRSSGLFEDSFSFPFAGIYSTFMLPNNQRSIEERARKVSDSIKLIYASLFSNSAKSYFNAINYNIQDEKMAIVLQNVIGRNYKGVFYPHISGIAQSYNYYPSSYMGMEDGVAVLAVGLGKYVVEGEIAFRFCPRYPKIDIIDKAELLNHNQKQFYAIDMERDRINLIEGEGSTLKELDIQGVRESFINYCVSVFDKENDRFEVGYNMEGPRVVNFANILKYNAVPVAKAIEVLLEIIKEAVGIAVEIEFAVDLGEDVWKNKPVFYILQIKPLFSSFEEVAGDIRSEKMENLLIKTSKAMGNGIIDNISDIVCADIESFSIKNSTEMALELERINEVFQKNNSSYILIGPGRWGTRDRWLGIPVKWAQISNAKVIVEIGMPDFQVEPSLGSHFFCNIISMNVGYLSVPYKSDNGFFDYNWLKKKKPCKDYRYFKHYRFDRPLRVVLDGRRALSVIYKDGQGAC